MDDGIELEYEIGTTFATTSKVIEDKNEVTKNIKFDYEAKLTFIGDQLVNPKYEEDESWYGKVVIVEKQMKEKEDVFDVTKIEKYF